MERQPPESDDRPPFKLALVDCEEEEEEDCKDCDCRERDRAERCWPEASEPVS